MKKEKGAIFLSYLIVFLMRFSTLKANYIFLNLLSPYKKTVNQNFYSFCFKIIIYHFFLCSNLQFKTDYIFIVNDIYFNDLMLVMDIFIIFVILFINYIYF